MLSEQRQKIDNIDKQIVALFEERMQVVEEVKEIKEKNHIPVLDSTREAEVYEKIISYLKDKSLASDLKILYSTLMDISKNRQK